MVDVRPGPHPQQSHLDRLPPAHDEGLVVLPAEAAGVHVRSEAHVVPQHVGDALLGADVIDLHTLRKKRRSTEDEDVFMGMVCVYSIVDGIIE